MTDQTQPTPAGVAHTYILLDRTGSMSAIWDEALSSVNAYAAGLAGLPDPKPHLTLAVFDAQNGLQFDVLRRKTLPADWKPVTDAEASPRGMTPLFDSIGRIVAMAEADNPNKAVLVIMTDGEENASREITREGAKAALERVTKRGWETVFLGAEFAKFADADAIGVAKGTQMAMSRGRMGETMANLARKSNRYYAASESMAFKDEERAQAGEAEVQQRQGVKPDKNQA
jgi:hypothetical protein